MVDKKRAQQIKRQRAARAAMAAAVAHRRRVRQRLIAAGVGAAVIVGAVVVVVLVATNHKGSSSAASSTTTEPDSTTVPPLPSAAGKPCVATKGPLPAGAPEVPVQVGPPPSSLVTRDLKPGTGAVITAADTLTVNYIGVSCSTGVIFDSSYSRNQPATFPLANVIPGWQQGIPGMKVGGERLLGIPPAMAYGADGQPPDIAPNETLWFVVDVLNATATPPTSTP